MYSGKPGCIQAKVAVFGQSGCIRAKVIFFVQSGCVFGKKWLYWAKVVVIGKKRIWAKMVVFRLDWLYSYSGKSGCKVVVFGQSGSQKWLFWAKVVLSKWDPVKVDKVVVFSGSGKSGKVVILVVVFWVFGQKWLYSGKVVVFKLVLFGQSAKMVLFWQKDCISEKVVVFGQKLLYSSKSSGKSCIRANSAKSGCIRAKVVFVKKLLYSGKVVVFRQSSYIFGSKSGCIGQKRLL